ncbi:hypothetical protein, partial [Microcoleus sp. herbarium5]|uniref:hypothetical protein n=1 Tax=Microcoleus sp. herbarium5 TaxID=3055434 RepID=UPI002FCF2ACF
GEKSGRSSQKVDRQIVETALYQILANRIRFISNPLLSIGFDMIYFWNVHQLGDSCDIPSKAQGRSPYCKPAPTQLNPNIHYNESMENI